MRRTQRLQFCPYKWPPYKVGQAVQCAIRGRVLIAGVSKGRIPWPYCVPRSRALIVYDDLERAIRQESASAVAYWWGVSIDTVGTWRRALGVGQYNPGTVKLRRAGYNSKERSQKIAAAKRGKPRPADVREKIRNALKRYYGT
jgi:hypothetical protein